MLGLIGAGLLFLDAKQTYITQYFSGFPLKLSAILPGSVLSRLRLFSHALATHSTTFTTGFYTGAIVEIIA